MKPTKTYRTEKDTMGDVLVPAHMYYGAQTQRAVQNFQISGQTLPRSFIKAQGIIKASAAKTNMEIGVLAENIGNSIILAAEEVIEGKWDAHFVVDIYQAGAGTAQNMNANEVIAHRASELISTSHESHTVHPNDHVNLSQSTNDTFHAAIHIAAAEQITHKLLPSLKALEASLFNKTEEFMPIYKAGRTHLHDAVPMRLGQEFSAYAETIRSLGSRVKETMDGLYEIGVGGTAIGTGLNAQPGFMPKVIEEISSRTGYPFRKPENLFEFTQNTNAPIRMMFVLKEISIHLIKLTSDLRLLSSGPRTGLAEITLPPVQPGSTIMPGKVNPAILEMVHMVCCHIIGYEAAMTTAGIAGQLEINVMMPIIAHTLLHSIEILSNAMLTLTEKCISGIEAQPENCEKWMELSLALVTVLSPILGYDEASKIGMRAESENKTIKQILKEKGLLTAEIEKKLDPRGMV